MTVLQLDGEGWLLHAPQPSPRPLPSWLLPRESSLAYVLFTSGSTGR